MDNITGGRPTITVPDAVGGRAPSAECASRGPLRTLDVPLERDVFLRTLLRELAGTLQDVVGLEEASGFVSVVGQNMGRQMDRDYRAALETTRLSREPVADVLQRHC